jgi:catechol 2,3-dioxygenase-like lactoylglutathione lyase family enzyme
MMIMIIIIIIIIILTITLTTTLTTMIIIAGIVIIAAGVGGSWLNHAVWVSRQGTDLSFHQGSSLMELAVLEARARNAAERVRLRALGGHVPAEFRDDEEAFVCYCRWMRQDGVHLTDVLLHALVRRRSVVCWTVVPQRGIAGCVSPSPLQPGEGREAIFLASLSRRGAGVEPYTQETLVSSGLGTE